jgi:chloramphenicol-sensitive protein RarD
MNKGIWNGLAAYVIWGFFPIYWKLLHQVPALQVIGHRISWSFILLIVDPALQTMDEFRSIALSFKTVRFIRLRLFSFPSTADLCLKVNAGFIVETSLGYFINPLFSVLLGVLFLRERLRPAQWIPVALAAGGVLYLTVAYGRLPRFARTHPFTFGLYGLVKKLAPLGSLYGLTLETAVVFPIALLYLVFVGVTGTGSFLREAAGRYSLDLYRSSDQHSTAHVCFRCEQIR